MTVTLADLLSAPRLRLRLVSERAAVADALLQSVTWVHSSDLDDPTPFLDPGQMLLTDGTQLPRDAAGDEFVDAYVARLAAHGVIALGFATQVVHGAIPDPLRVACERHGLVLLEVPERIPFIAIIRHVADAIAAEQRAALTRRLEALRAIARAARRADALTAILRELERLLGVWVTLYDAAGEPIGGTSLHAVPSGLSGELREAVLATLARRHGGAHHLEVGAAQATLQTIGSNDRRLGVLVIGGVVTDTTRDELVGSAVAFAGIALGHEYTLMQSRLAVRSAAFALMRQGRLEEAAVVVRAMQASMPAGPVVVLVAVQSEQVGALGALETWAEGRRRFFAVVEGEIVVLCHDRDAAAAAAILGEAGAAVGMSRAAEWSRLDEALRGARRARLEGERRGGGVVHVDELLARGHLSLIEPSDAALLAEQALMPLRDVRTTDGGALLDTVVLWMRNDCAWGRTAEGLGLHRHSVRSRIDAAAQLLGDDLDSAGGRARLWTALALAGML